MSQPTGKTLTLDLLSTLRGGSMPIAALIAAGEVFGVAEGSLRVAVTRLVARGQVERDARGRYRLGRAADPVSHQLHGWRKLDERVCRWNGRFIGVHLGLESGGRIIRQLVFDPLLPKPLVDPESRRALVQAMRHYDQCGRRIWAAFMERHGAPHTRNPVHSGGGKPLPSRA
ncbi:MAG: hypothetical protein GY723_00050 [bacterium]|nr:hypothetical protein [bacterium]